MEDCCECGNEPSSFIQRGKCLDCVRNCLTSQEGLCSMEPNIKTFHKNTEVRQFPQGLPFTASFLESSNNSAPPLPPFRSAEKIHIKSTRRSRKITYLHITGPPTGACITCPTYTFRKIRYVKSYYICNIM